MPKMTSMSERFKTIVDAEKIAPWIEISTSGTKAVEFVLEPGETIDNC
jgi:hypothetical protein